MSLTDVNLFRIDGTLGSVSNISTASLNGGPLAGTRNRTINGDMRIDQRNAGASVTPTGDGTYTLDRWAVRNFAGSGRYSIQHSTSSVPAGFSHAAVLTVTTADTTNASSYTLCQRIEAFNTSDLGLGSSAANSISISFWVRSSVTGTYCVSIRNSNADRSYISEYTISAANTWEYKTLTVPTVATGTWEVTNGIGIILDFTLGSNSARETTAGAWQTGNFIGSSNQAEWIATLGATFYITGVQLEPGSTATPFERRSYGQELALCQRYYETGRVSAFAGVINTHHLGAPCFYKVTKRAVPTVALVNVSNVQFPSTVGGVQAPTTVGFNETRVANNTAANGQFQSDFTASAEL
jgi:hypothetical protein